jgi:hypothetical protein
MRIALLAAMAVLVLLVLAFGFAGAWLVWDEAPWDPNAGDR